jgi:glutathione S-transferase
MKLYYSPGACSLSPHIALIEAGLPFELRQVSTKTHQLADGTNYYTINPKGYVPLLEFDDGQRLSEGPAIVQWIADQVPDKRLAPPAGTMARYRLMEWLNFISTEVHKNYSPLFSPATPEEAKAQFRAKLVDRYTYVDGMLEGRDYLLGSDFSVADAYLFVVSRWAHFTQVDIASFSNLANFMARVAARPAVQQALQAEGLKG